MTEFKKGKQYHFFENGIINNARHYYAKVQRILTYSDLPESEQCKLNLSQNINSHIYEMFIKDYPCQVMYFIIGPTGNLISCMKDYQGLIN